MYYVSCYNSHCGRESEYEFHSYDVNNPYLKVGACAKESN
jgi:hypothetical protein